MKHDVFISYSHKDQFVADQIYDKLQKESISCWMAPNSLKGGDEYEDIIWDAINVCSYVIFICSSSSVASRWVNSEISIAFESNKRIIPFKIEDVILPGRLKLKINQSQWIDASEDITSKMDELISDLKSAIVPTISPSPQVNKQEIVKPATTSSTNIIDILEKNILIWDEDLKITSFLQVVKIKNHELYEAKEHFSLPQEEIIHFYYYDCTLFLRQKHFLIMTDRKIYWHMKKKDPVNSIAWSDIADVQYQNDCIVILDKDNSSWNIEIKCFTGYPSANKGKRIAEILLECAATVH